MQSYHFDGDENRLEDESFCGKSCCYVCVMHLHFSHEWNVKFMLINRRRQLMWFISSVVATFSMKRLRRRLKMRSSSAHQLTHFFYLYRNQLLYRKSLEDWLVERLMCINDAKFNSGSFLCHQLYVSLGHSSKMSLDASTYSDFKVSLGITKRIPATQLTPI